MAIRGVSITVTYNAWNYTANNPQTGDSANHSVYLVLDNAAAVLSTNSPAEVSAVNAPGKYKLTLTAPEMSHNVIGLCGKSSTSGVALFFGGDIITEQNVLNNTYQNTLDIEGTSFSTVTDSLHAAQVLLTAAAAKLTLIDNKTTNLPGSPAAVGSNMGTVTSVVGDVGGKVLGGGAGVITGTGVRAVDSSGNAIAPASTALSTSTWTPTMAGYLDVAVSSRSTLTQAQILSDSIPFPGARIDAAISSRSTYAGGAVASVTGDVAGKILGGGGGVIAAVGAWVLDGSGASVAPASTALSNVVWTNAKAANIDANISSRSSHTAADIWDVALAGHLGVGTTGLALNTASSGSSPAAIADAVWDELLAGHVIAGSAGVYLHGAGSAGDPWATVLPGAYGAGTAGYIVGSTGGSNDFNSWPIQKYLKK